MSLRHQMLGFIGIGRMGSCMARNLLGAGAKVLVCDTDQEAVSNLEKAGATKVSSPAELASTPGLEAIITMLPSPAAVRDAYLRPNYGILSVEQQTLHPWLLIDSSTIDPITAREVAAAAQDAMLHPDAASTHNQQYASMIDAPVSGGVVGAENGTLTFMVGGSEKAFDGAEPILNAMGKRAVYCGDHGNGAAAKLANNLVLAITMTAVSEGLEFGRRHGLDPVLLTRIFNSSSAHCWSSEKYNPVPGVMEGVPSSRDYTGGFSSALMIKDLNLALQSGKISHAPLPMTREAKKLYESVASVAEPPSLPPDFSAVYKYVYKQKDEE